MSQNNGKSIFIGKKIISNISLNLPITDIDDIKVIHIYL